MRYAIASLPFLILTASAAAADPTMIEQNAKTNYAVIVAGKNKQSSDVSVKQSGHINGLTSLQSADQNSLATSQKGWRNAIVIYQVGWTDISSLAQSGPIKGASVDNLPTSYSMQNTDDGYLSYFASGGFSMVTLTDPGNTITSRFGRYR
jgi:hypothetical protein